MRPEEVPSALERGARGLVWSSAGTLGQIALRLIAYALLARAIAPESFGAFAAALVVLELIESLAVLSLNRVLIAEPALEPAVLQAATTHMALVGLVLGGGVVALRVELETALQVQGLAEVLVWIGWLPALSCASMGPRALLQRELRFRRLMAVDLAGHLAFVLFAVPLAWAGGQQQALIVGLLAQVVVRSAVAIVSAPSAMRARWRPRTLWRLLLVGGVLSIETLSAFVLRKVDRLVVGRVLGAGPLGVYDRAASLIERALQLVVPSYSKVLFATTARVQNSAQDLRRVLGVSLEVSAALTLPVASCVALLAPEIVAILLGPRWAASSTVLRVLGWTLFTVHGMTIASNVLVASGHVKVAVASSVATAAAVIGMVLAGSRVGLGGVAAGVLSGTLAGHVALVAAACRSTGQVPGAVARRYLAPALCAATILAAGGLARAAMHLTSAGPVVRTLAVTVAAWGTLAGLAWWAPQRMLGEASRAALAQVLRARGLRGSRLQQDAER